MVSMKTFDRPIGGGGENTTEVLSIHDSIQ